MNILENKVDRYKNYILIGEELLLDEDYINSYKAFLKALNFAKKDEEILNTLFQLSDIALYLNKYKDAYKFYKKIIEIDNNQAGAYYGLGITNDFLDGDLNFSKEYYLKAIDIDNSYDRAYYYLAHVYDKLNEKEKARACFEKCIDLNENDYVSYNDLGSIYEEMKDFEKAQNLFEKSLEIKSNYFRALYNMGVIRKRFNDLDGALYYYNLAKKEDDYLYIYLNMSAIYIERKEYLKALKILDEGIEKNPNAEKLFYNRSCVNVILNNFKNAKKDLMSAYKLNKEVKVWAETDIDLIEFVKEIVW